MTRDDELHGRAAVAGWGAAMSTNSADIVLRYGMRPRNSWRLTTQLLRMVSR